jgi:hypothetical protein
MQKRQANPKLPSKSLILIGSRQGTDAKSVSSSASVTSRLNREFWSLPLRV